MTCFSSCILYPSAHQTYTVHPFQLNKEKVSSFGKKWRSRGLKKTICNGFVSSLRSLSKGFIRFWDTHVMTCLCVIVVKRETEFIGWLFDVLKRNASTTAISWFWKRRSRGSEFFKTLPTRTTTPWHADAPKSKDNGFSGNGIDGNVERMHLDANVVNVHNFTDIHIDLSQFIYCPFDRTKRVFDT